MFFLELPSPVDGEHSDLAYFTREWRIGTFVLYVSAKILQMVPTLVLAARTLKLLVAHALFSYMLLKSFERKYFFILLIESAFVIELGRQNMQLSISWHLLHESKLLRIGFACRTFAALFLSHSLDACSAKQVLTNFALLRILVGEIQTNRTIVLFYLISIFIQSCKKSSIQA